MASVKVPGKVIQAGYDWSMRLVIGGEAIFPVGATFRAQVRRAPEVDDVLHTMTTDNGGAVLIDERTINLTVPGAATAGWPSRKVYIDIVRTDGLTPQHLGFRLIVPVQQPITR